MGAHAHTSSLIVIWVLKYSHHIYDAGSHIYNSFNNVTYGRTHTYKDPHVSYHMGAHIQLPTYIEWMHTH